MRGPQGIRGGPAFGKFGDLKVLVCSQVDWAGNLAAICRRETGAELFERAELPFDPWGAGIDVFLEDQNGAALMHEGEHHLLPSRISGLMDTIYAETAFRAYGRLKLLQVAPDQGFAKFCKQLHGRYERCLG